MKKQKQNKKDRILKGVVCYKLKIIPRSIGGGMFDGAKFERLEELILEVVKDHPELSTFISTIINKTDRSLEDKVKRNKIFNEIFAEDVFEPSDSLRDTEEEKEKKKEMREHSQKVKRLLYYLNSDNKTDTVTNDNKETLLAILHEKQRADKIKTDILASLETDTIKKQLTPSQISAIKSKIEGTGGITTALSSVKSSFYNGAVSLGSWLAPEIVDDDGSPKQLENKQKVTFFWYPRKHIDYVKGSSGSKRGKDDATEYGDFMIMIEPEQFASTGEFFKQKYHSVEDLLATVLMGCDGPFCLRGEAKRKPYNWREYEITNKQPMKDKEKKSNKALVEA